MVDIEGEQASGMELPESVANSPFFKLPREIRDRIYTYCLSSRDGVPVEWPSPPPWQHMNIYDLHPQLLRICNIIHREAAPLLYTLNNMTFHHPSDANVFVRAFASPVYGRQISKLSLHIKAQDMRTWMPYLTSADDARSLKADFSNLKELGVRFRSNKWNARESPENNLKAWCEDNRLDEVIDGLRHVFMPRASPGPGRRGHSSEEQGNTNGDPVGRRLDERPVPARPAVRQKARAQQTSTAPRTDPPIIRVCCACRVHSSQFNALTTPGNLSDIHVDADGAQTVPPNPVKEGEPFRGFTALDLQNGVTKLYNPELGSANVARTPYNVRKGILLALEIHCIDSKKEAA